MGMHIPVSGEGTSEEKKQGSLIWRISYKAAIPPCFIPCMVPTIRGGRAGVIKNIFLFLFGIYI
jgi:hypothetical protein